MKKIIGIALVAALAIALIGCPEEEKKKNNDDGIRKLGPGDYGGVNFFLDGEDIELPADFDILDFESFTINGEVYNGTTKLATHSFTVLLFKKETAGEEFEEDNFIGGPPYGGDEGAASRVATYYNKTMGTAIEISTNASGDAGNVGTGVAADNIPDVIRIETGSPPSFDGIKILSIDWE